MSCCGRGRAVRPWLAHVAAAQLGPDLAPAVRAGTKRCHAQGEVVIDALAPSLAFVATASLALGRAPGQTSSVPWTKTWGLCAKACPRCAAALHQNGVSLSKMHCQHSRSCLPSPQSVHLGCACRLAEPPVWGWFAFESYRGVALPEKTALSMCLKRQTFRRACVGRQILA